MQMAENLKAMLSILESERQALAGLDLERIITCADGKQKICSDLEAVEVLKLDEECEGLLNAVRRLNDINRRLRNMIADNVSARLGALTGTSWLYGRPMESVEIMPR